MTNFDRVVLKLEHLGDERPEPEDHLYNITQAVQGIDLNDEEWCNFYRYITSQNKKEFEYLPRDKIVTLGDLGDDELKRIAKKISYGEDQTVEYFQNGIETTMIVKNVEPIKLKDDGTKFLDPACEILPCLSQGGISKNCPQSSLKNVQEESRSSEDEKEN
jgi:hypothetical protein